MIRRQTGLALLVIVATLFTSCSINKLAVRAVSNALATPGGPSVFETDNDPELVGDALPFALKLYDTLLAQNPEDVNLLRATGSAYISYANAFLQTPAEMLPQEEFEQKQHMIQRAKNLYVRGRDMELAALDVRYPGFQDTLFGNSPESVVENTGSEDVALLYWAAAGWMGAFSTDPMDLDLALSVKRAALLMNRAYTLNPEYGDGAIHEFYISYYAGLPEGMGGDKSKATEHYKAAVRLAGDKKASIYVSYATAMFIPTQNVNQFVSVMKRALEIDPDAYPEYRLLNTIKQRQARWYLDHLDRFFIVSPDQEE